VITSKDILEKTGLRSAKTLTRWHQRGLIPEPLVRTHPSGRGKLAYWPDWVLDRCLRIVELQKQGHSLQSAARVLDIERWNRTIEYAESQLASISDLLASQQARLGPGREGTLLDAYLLGMLASVKHLVVDPGERRVLLAKLKEARALDRALDLARAGYNPVLMYDGQDLDIVPDFLVGQRLSEELPAQKAFCVAPVLPTLRAAFPALDKVVGSAPKAWPAPKVWVRDGDAVVEYIYFPAGPIGFELIRETAKVVSTLPDKAGTDADAGA
jgi:hypothetical protein